MAPKERVNWDETNLQANEEESLAANRMKIDEPKTPFHRLKEDGEEPESFPPKAAAATSSGTIHGDVLAGLDPAALVAAVEAKRDESSTPEDPEGKGLLNCRSHVLSHSMSRLQKKPGSSMKIVNITTRWTLRHYGNKLRIWTQRMTKTTHAADTL